MLLIDEINRGNVAKVFGELYYLLEYRDEKIALQYSADPFALPKNLWIIGTMNTADRSIAFLDAALRRRFRERRFRPDYAALDGWLKENVSATVASDAVARLGALNAALIELLDEDRLIGHSYLMKKDLAEVGYQLVWDEELEPVLREHLFTRLDELERLRQIFVE